MKPWHKAVAILVGCIAGLIFLNLFMVGFAYWYSTEGGWEEKEVPGVNAPKRDDWGEKIFTGLIESTETQRRAR